MLGPEKSTAKINSRYREAGLNACGRVQQDRKQIYGTVFTMKRYGLFLFDLHHPKRKLEL